MKSEMQKLLDRVRRLTKPRGMKSKLAGEVLHVPRSSITDWLAGRYKPGGDTALRLSKWADDEERRQTKK